MEHVCFTVAEMGRLLPHRQPVEFDVEYRSVVIFGRARLLDNLEAKRCALQMLLDKYAPHLQAGVDYDEIPEYDLKRTSVYCIEIDAWSGKRNEAAPDFQGAYEFPAVRNQD
jgi:nitroimidazol reductase NimA-like FMN-containing flavoprotein (pyridoxamine 5'-phosphate oxidase superfamily)